MATIVEFNALPRRTEPVPAIVRGPAEIVFFPGVRYERAEQSGAAKPGKSKAGRDTIEIES